MKLLSSRGGGHWDFRFWLFFRSVFRFLCLKTSVFWFWCSLRFADSSLLSISVFGFRKKILAVFRFSCPEVVSGFSYFVLLRFRFLFDLSGNWPRIAAKGLFRGMRDNLNVTVGDQRCISFWRFCMPVAVLAEFCLRFCDFSSVLRF